MISDLVLRIKLEKLTSNKEEEENLILITPNYDIAVVPLLQLVKMLHLDGITLQFKLKKEIVTLGMPSVSPIERVGTYVSPEEWNDLISDPETVVIDMRNTYETRIGKFKGAVDPCTTAFRNFPSWVENQFALKQEGNEHKQKCLKRILLKPPIKK